MKIQISIILLFLFTCLGSEVKGQDLPQTSISFDTTVFEFDTIKSGEIVEHTFNFHNSGENPLFVHQVYASCGCTTMEYTNDTLAPGEKGYIKVRFDSKDKSGDMSKHFEVLSNGEYHILYLKGYVIKEE
jgi:hypothetical protein